MLRTQFEEELLNLHNQFYEMGKKIFMNPEKQETEDYISGRFG